MAKRYGFATYSCSNNVKIVPHCKTIFSPRAIQENCTANGVPLRKNLYVRVGVVDDEPEALKSNAQSYSRV